MKLPSLLLLLGVLSLCICQTIPEGQVVQIDPCDIEIGLNLRYIVQKFWGENTITSNDQQQVTFHFDFFFTQPSFLSRGCFKKGIKRLSFIDPKGQPLVVLSSDLIEDQKGIQFSLLYNQISDYSFSSSDYKNGAGTKYQLNMVFSIGNTRKYVREYSVDFAIIVLSDLSIQFSNFLVNSKTAQASASFGK